MTPIFQAQGLSLQRQGQWLLQDIELRVEAGQLHVLLGPNGAGKSSLLRCLAGEWHGTAGDVRLDGRPLHQHSARQQACRRAVLPQTDALSFGLPVQELVALGRHAAADQRPQTMLEIVTAAMTAVDIAPLRLRAYDTLSGGERRRAQLARVLAQVWDVAHPALLLDEPTHSLDPAHQHAVLDLLRTLANRGFAILISLHDLNLAAAYAQHISLVRQGRLIASGTAEKILDEARLRALYGEGLRFTAMPCEGQIHWIARRV